MLDTSRNFKPVEWILKMIDVMALYKLNKLHFHLTDDEGWRLEMPSIPELTDVSTYGMSFSNAAVHFLSIILTIKLEPGESVNFILYSEYNRITKAFE